MEWAHIHLQSDYHSFLNSVLVKCKYHFLSRSPTLKLIIYQTAYRNHRMGWLALKFELDLLKLNEILVCIVSPVVSFDTKLCPWKQHEVSPHQYDKFYIIQTRNCFYHRFVFDKIVRTNNNVIRLGIHIKSYLVIHIWVSKLHHNGRHHPITLKIADSLSIVKKIHHQLLIWRLQKVGNFVQVSMYLCHRGCYNTGSLVTGWLTWCEFGFKIACNACRLV